MNTQQDTQQQSSHTSRPRFRHAAFVTGVSVAAFVAAGSMTSATAMHPVDGPSLAAPPSTDGTVTTPCFDVPTPDRWPTDAGAMPRCTHTWGAATNSFGVDATSNERKPAMDSPCFMTSQRWSFAVDGDPRVCATD